MKQTSLAKLVFVMLVVACGSAAVLAWVYAITREPIKKPEKPKNWKLLPKLSTAVLTMIRFRKNIYQHG